MQRGLKPSDVGGGQIVRLGLGLSSWLIGQLCVKDRPMCGIGLFSMLCGRTARMVFFSLAGGTCQGHAWTICGSRKTL